MDENLLIRWLRDTTFIAGSSTLYRRDKLKVLPTLGLLAILFAFLIAGSSLLVSAQTGSQQYVGGGGGLIRGNVYGFDMWDELEPIAWASVTATNGQYRFVAYTGGSGYYEMFVPVGAYNVTVNPAGYVPYSNTVSVSDGSSSAINFYLEESHVPVPEYPQGAFIFVLFAALASVLIVQRMMLKRRRVE